MVVGAGVRRSDSVVASYLNATNALDGAEIGDRNISIVSDVNFVGAFTASGRTITAAGSGTFAPLGFLSINVSGSSVVVPYFAP